jgi:tetraacyldisaccharide 4'-kinase
MSDVGPVGALGSLALRPVSWIWRAAAKVRNARFDRGEGVRRAPVPVVSVGNLTAGGTGKTPFVAWAAATLRASGRRPAIAMRGYGAGNAEMSDEAREYAITVPEVPVLVGADRHATIVARLAAEPGAIDVVLLDDGFQHRALARDLDLVLVDAARPALDSPILPSGWLREPAEGLRRASAVIVTRAERIDPALEARISALHGRPPIAWCRHAWRGLDLMRGGNAERVGVEWLAGRRLFGVFGVGNPDAVRAAYGRAGATIVDDAGARDHATYGRADLERWIARAASAGADAIATTRKDWTKIRDLAPPDTPPFVVPDVALAFVDGASAVESLLARAVGERHAVDSAS